MKKWLVLLVLILGFLSSMNPVYGRMFSSKQARFISPDPVVVNQQRIINPQGLNLYSYVLNNPLKYVDPTGKDIAVIENGPTSGFWGYIFGGSDGNPIGHTAFAVTGRGVFSAGNDTPAGSSMYDYFARQSPNRDTMVVIIQTTPEQDQAAIDSFMRQARTPLEKYPDNCSQRTNDALNAAEIPTADELARTAITFVQPTAMQTNPSLPGTAGNRAQEYNNRSGTGQSVPVPQGTQGLPAPLQQFEPKKPEAVPNPPEKAKEQR